MKKTLLSILALGAFLSANAEIIMPKVFSDYMVLQREMPVKIWGKADAKASVKVEFASQAKETTACENGNWSLLLEPMQANATNQSMTIYENGKSAKEIKDILVGEVWIAGGQSNMFRNFAQANTLKLSDTRINNSSLRMFSQQSDAATKEPQFDSPEGAKWQLSTTQSYTDFSCVGFFFAEKLISELNVPVAIIQTPAGGSSMIAWLASEDLTTPKTFVKGKESTDEILADYDYEKEVKIFKKNKKKNKLFTPRPQAPASYRKLASLLYNAKIAPIAGYTARGFLWYQGEADAGNAEFSAMLEQVIKSWRKYWGDYYELDDGKLEKETMPFYFVQLPAFEAKDKDWAKTRWYQYLATKKLDDVEMIVSIDTGEENNIHPTDKDIIGNRLASLALGETYDLKKFDDYDFPIVDEVKYNGSQVEVEFDTETDLVIKGALRGFEVLVGKKWVAPVLVKLKDDEIILKTKDDSEILGVRYLWKNWTKPDVSLYNELDLPAMSFIDYR